MENRKQQRAKGVFDWTLDGHGMMGQLGRHFNKP